MDAVYLIWFQYAIVCTIYSLDQMNQCPFPLFMVQIKCTVVLSALIFNLI